VPGDTSAGRVFLQGSSCNQPNQHRLSSMLSRRRSGYRGLGCRPAIHPDNAAELITRSCALTARCGNAAANPSVIGSYSRARSEGGYTASGLQDLEWFARESLLRGFGKEEIRKAMLEVGWTEDQARNALDACADMAFAVPIPKPRPQLPARDAFFYLVLFTTLYISSYNLGSLLFDFIDRALPDATIRTYRAVGWDSMRWSATSLIVAFPIFLMLSYYIGKDLSHTVHEPPIHSLSRG
jgi:hypothetical protein